jgi:hypothetical protein
MAAHCPFCGIAGTRKSGEHGFPAWTDDCVPGSGALRITDELESGAIRTRRAPELDIKANICEACNTGWMHRLEEQVRGFLCPLMAGQTALLSPAQQHLTARWTSKTLLALDLTRRPRIVPKREYGWIMNNAVPPSSVSRMWAIAYDGQEGGWKFVRKGLRFGPVGQITDRIDGYCSTIRIGHLCLQIFGNFHVRQDLEPRERPEMANHQFWPPTGRVMIWPINRVVLDDASFAAFANRFSANNVVI